MDNKFIACHIIPETEDPSNRGNEQCRGFQVNKFLKNLRDLTVVRKLNKEGYSLNQSHVSAVREDLMPEEVEALLRKRYSKSKGKSFWNFFLKTIKNTRQDTGSFIKAFKYF